MEPSRSHILIHVINNGAIGQYKTNSNISCSCILIYSLLILDKL